MWPQPRGFRALAFLAASHSAAVSLASRSAVVARSMAAARACEARSRSIAAVRLVVAARPLSERGVEGGGGVGVIGMAMTGGDGAVRRHA